LRMDMKNYQLWQEYWIIIICFSLLSIFTHFIYFKNQMEKNRLKEKTTKQDEGMTYYYLFLRVLYKWRHLFFFRPKYENSFSFFFCCFYNFFLFAMLCVFTRLLLYIFFLFLIIIILIFSSVSQNFARRLFSR
jgi:hypothetical protein